MAIGFRASSSADVAAATGTVTITKPTGSASTDVLTAVFGNDWNAASNPDQVTTAPSGWTAIGTAQQSPAAGNRIGMAAFWALGSVAGLGFTNLRTGGSYQQGWVCGAF